eukprot:11924556-Ditylum_brightwellii.AAC.1
MAIILTDKLCKVKVEHEEEYKKWMEKNEPHWKEEYIPIPKFHLQTTTRQFGNGPGRVMTTVIVMECAAEDAGCLKLLLNKLYTNGKPQYVIFIPTVAVTGISDNAMWEHIQLNGNKTCLGDFLSEVQGLKAIERTNKTEQEGK